MSDRLHLLCLPKLRFHPLSLQGFHAEPIVGGKKLSRPCCNISFKRLLAFAQSRFNTSALRYLLLSRAEQARLVDCDRSLGRNSRHKPFRTLIEHTRFRMAEEQAAQHFSAMRHDGHRKIASHPQVPGRMAVVWRILSVTRIFRDVG